MSAPVRDLVTAAELIVTSQFGSQQMLERKLRIAGGEAAELIAELERARIVGPAVDGEPRTVLVGPEDLDEALARLREHVAREQLIVDSEALDGAHGGEVVLRGGLGVDVVHPDVQELEVRPVVEVAPRPGGELGEPDEDERPHLVGRLLERPCDVVAAVVESHPARSVVDLLLGLVRLVVLAVKGYESWGKRAWSYASHGDLRRAVRAAEDAGDRESQLLWKQLLETARNDRVKRLKEWLRDILPGAARIAAAAPFALAGLLVVIGAGVQLTPGGRDWVSWWEGIGVFITTCGEAVAWVFRMGKWVAVPLLLVAGVREGRRVASDWGWLQTSADADIDAAIDESMIARALEALRIPQISAYLKTGSPLQFLTPCRVDGRGTHAVIRLPAGVTAERIARRRADLATGLHRLAKEVWPTTGSEEGILDLWVADKGALAEGAGPHPLLEDGRVDIYKGVPFGKSLRGAPLTAPVMERNTITGGMPGQGKSSAARCIMVGAALDPTAELRIWVPDANFDFEVFRPRCSRYVMGAEDERIEEILEDLRELHREVQVRGELLVRYEIPAVTREYASKGVGLHPIVALLEEAHVAIQHPRYGAEISKLLVDIVRLGRKRGIHIIVSTQAPTKDSMPRDVTRNCSNGIAFAVGDHVANDALLGQGAYRAGHRATELIPGTDRGIAVVKGFSGQRSEIVQVYFLDVERGNDQVTPIIERSLDVIARAGRKVPGTGPSTAALMTERDLLEDLDAVLGDEPVRAADLPALLAAYASGWAPYKRLTGKALRQRLGERYGVKVASTGNRWPVDPVAVRAALAQRATADLDDSDDDE